VLAVVLGVLVGAPAAWAAPVAPQLAVDGNALVDTSSGAPRPLQLRGVDRSGTEYACSSGADPSRPGQGGYAIFDGPTYNSYDPSRPDVPSDIRQPDATIDAMVAWGVNAVRVPLSDTCWFGDRSLNPAYSGTAYQNAVADYVDQLARHGLVAILSLHVASTTVDGAPSPNLGLRLLPMPDAVQGPRFWDSVVQRLGSALPANVRRRENVVLDLFNEPHLDERAGVAPEDGWRCWRLGCRVNTEDPPTTPPATTDPTPAYTTVGMQDLVRGIRRKERDTGSPVRPLMLGGLDYANDLSGWTANLPTVDDGHGGEAPAPGLVASFHVYGGATRCAAVACWDDEVAPVLAGAAPHPVVAGEVGQYDCRADVTSRFADWSDAQAGAGVSYLAWTWNAMYQGTTTSSKATGWRCDGGPTLLKYNDGTPTDAYGLGYCQHLRAAAGLPGTGTAPTNPCPAARVPSEPPADATPVVTTPPSGPTGPTTPPADPGPFPPPVTAPPTVVPPAATAPVPTPTPTPTATTVRPVEPRTARVTSRALRLVRGKVAVAVSCARGTTPCRGRITVRTTKKVALGRRRVAAVLLSVAYDVRAGRSAKLSARPTADGRRLLRRTRRIAAVATATSTGGLPAVRRLTLTR
jgi:hypothetical protein